MLIVSILIFITGFTVLVLGFFIFISDSKNKSNKLFATFATITGLWVINNGFLNILPSSISFRLSYGLGVLVPLSNIIWLLNFTSSKLKYIYKLLFITVGVVFLFICVTTNLVVVSFSSDGLILGYRSMPGPLFFPYSIYIGASLLFIVGYLVRSLFNVDGVLKTQMIYIFAGSMIFASASFMVSFILPTFFDNFNYTILDNFSSLLYVLAISYAIAKHHLMNVRVIAVELFSGAIIIVSLVSALLSQTANEIVVRVIILVGVIIFSVLLIRSVIKEVETRERAEKLATDLDVANTNLAKLLKMKSEFLNLVSHQLRTPLTAVVGFLEWWKTGEINKLPPEKQKEMMNNVVASADRLHNVVEDILTVLKVQSETQYKFEPFDLIKNVKEAAELVQPIYAKKGLTLELKDLPEALMLPSADQRFLKQVWINLIDNAAKYTETGGTVVSIKMYPDPIGTYNQFVGGLSEGGVKLSAETAPTPPPAVPANGKNGSANVPSAQQKWVYVLIKDTGIGLDQDDKNRLFKQFSRGSEANKMNTTGSGLGLYLVKEIIDAHAGTIEVQSEGKGKGSTFVVGLRV